MREKAGEKAGHSDEKDLALNNIKNTVSLKQIKRRGAETVRRRERKYKEKKGG